MKLRGKRYAAAGLAAGLVAGGGIGLIAQSTGGVSAASTAQSTESVTDDENSQPGDRQPGDRLGEVLQPLIDDGTLTQEQADKVVETIVAARPMGGDGMGGRPGGGGPGGHHGGGQMMRESFAEVAELLGLTTDELKTAMREEDQTLATIAEANGSSAQAVIDLLVTNGTERINTAVADGRITQEKADEMLAELPERVTEFVNNGAQRPWNES
jgi:polyhydroxyalkanoate synthesis regulator phasin